MKTRANILMLSFAALAISFSSCEKEPDAGIANENNAGVETAQNLVTDPELLNLIESLEIDNRQPTRNTFYFPDGTSEERIFIGDDIAIKESSLRDMAPPTEEQAKKQYRARYILTGSNRTVDVIGYTGNDQFGLSTKAQTGLRWAVDNYNRVSNSSLRFRLTYGTDFESKDMVVYDTSQRNPGNAGGVADFPSRDGRPNKFVQIYNIENFSTNVNELVIMHEIGHSIGFRHTDWFDRLSCPRNSQGNEGGSATLIPGTPSGRDNSSFMTACFSGSTDGELNANDVRAIQQLY